MQHEVVRGLGVDVGYFRRAFNNFTVTQNRAVTPADFTTYSIPVPVDSRLPNSGQTLGGLRDVNPDQFGRIDNYVTAADNFGGQTEVFNGVDFNANARLQRFGRSRWRQHRQGHAGHLRHRRRTTPKWRWRDARPVGNVQSTTMCHVETPFLTQAKLFTTYNVPKVGVGVAATFQSLPGPLVAANYIANNAVVSPSLGRPLSGGVANATVNLVRRGRCTANG